MPLYTFFLQDGPHTVPRFEIDWLDFPEDAEAHGRRLLRERPRCSAVTVAEGELEIARIVRQPA